MPKGPLNRETIEAALAPLVDPETGRPMAKMEQIRDIAVHPKQADVRLALTNWARPLWDDVHKEAESLLREALPDDTVIHVRIVEHERPPEKIGQIGVAAKSVIAVGSGKGGVGKSTVAASIAYGLKNAGAAVGLMDADVYGPSIPHLLGATERRIWRTAGCSPSRKTGSKS